MRLKERTPGIRGETEEKTYDQVECAGESGAGGWAGCASGSGAAVPINVPGGSAAAIGPVSATMFRQFKSVALTPMRVRFA